MAYISTLAKAAGFTSPSTWQSTDSPAQISTTKSPSSTSNSPGAEISAHRTTRKVNSKAVPKATVLHSVKGAKIVKSGKESEKRRSSFWGLDNLANLFVRKKALEVKDLEGDTLVDDGENTEQVEDVTLITEGEHHQGFHKEHEASKHHRHHDPLDYDDARLATWTDEEEWLFERISRRSKEALFPRDWQFEFSHFPARLFTDDESKAFITNNYSSRGNAINAFSDLCKGGLYVRNNVISGAQIERPLHRLLKAYYKWTLKDGKLQHKAHIPVTAIACAKPGESVASVVYRVTDMLHDLSRQYRDKWRHPASQESDLEQRFVHPMPTLFGFVIVYSVVAIVTCDSNVPLRPVRTVHTGDWKVMGQEYWHAMCVAIAFVRQRNYLMQLDRDGELGPEIIDTYDPDL